MTTTQHDLPAPSGTMGDDDARDSLFGRTLVTAARLPGVRIDRADYLRRSLAPYCSEEQVSRAVDETPAAAGVPKQVISDIADASIRHEASRVTTLSALAGFPGGLALLGTIPADTVQYLGHMLRVAQKLAYLYSWPDLFEENDEPDDATQNVLTLFVGVMFGVQAANKGLGIVAAKFAEQVARRLPQQALTKGVVYPLVKAVAKQLGVQMTKSVFAKGLAKAIPVVGSVLSGGLTLASFLPMSKRLKKHLASLPTTTSAA